MKKRDAQIEKAEKALRLRFLTAQQFLQQLIFKQGHQDPNFIFRKLSDADDYFAEFDEEDGDDENDNNPCLNMPKAPVDPKDALLCKVCYVNNFDCMFLPCKHACCCVECYNKLKDVDSRRNDFDDLLTDEETNALLADEPTPEATCPICRETVESIIDGILT